MWSIHPVLKSRTFSVFDAANVNRRLFFAKKAIGQKSPLAERQRITARG